MKRLAIVGAGFAVAAGFNAAALGQSFRLDLTLTARSISGGPGAETITDIQTGGVVQAVPGTLYRVELRYRIFDLVADTVGSRGLSAANIGFTRTGTGSGSQRASYLSNAQVWDATVRNPDTSGVTSGVSDPNAELTGLIGPFRGLLGGLLGSSPAANTDPANAGGGALGNTWIVTPLAISAPGHNSWASGPNPSAANTNANPAYWSIFSFDFLYHGGRVDFLATALPEPSGARFSYFRRTGGTWSAVPPPPSNLATDGSISFVPAPGAAALLGLGGLIAARRRRA